MSADAVYAVWGRFCYACVFGDLRRLENWTPGGGGVEPSEPRAGGGGNEKVALLSGDFATPSGMVRLLFFLPNVPATKSVVEWHDTPAGRSSSTRTGSSSSSCSSSTSDSDSSSNCSGDSHSTSSTCSSDSDTDFE